MYQGLIPFNSEGLITCTSSKPHLTASGVYWKPNEIFEDELEFIGYFKGRSAVNMKFESIKTGMKYYMGLSAFFHASQFMINRKLAGKFHFYKQGQSYLLELCE
jgi:hypothetical protein